MDQTALGSGSSAESWRWIPGIRFWGQQRNVESYMQGADCLVCPSVWAEAAGLVIFEALACGLPVIASDIGGIPEAVRDGENGHLFTPGDPKQLAVGVRQLLEATDSLDALRETARSTAVERFPSVPGSTITCNSTRLELTGVSHTVNNERDVKGDRT